MSKLGIKKDVSGKRQIKQGKRTPISKNSRTSSSNMLNLVGFTNLLVRESKSYTPVDL